MSTPQPPDSNPPPRLLANRLLDTTSSGSHDFSETNRNQNIAGQAEEAQSEASRLSPNAPTDEDQEGFTQDFSLQSDAIHSKINVKFNELMILNAKFGSALRLCIEQYSEVQTADTTLVADLNKLRELTTKKPLEEQALDADALSLVRNKPEPASFKPVTSSPTLSYSKATSSKLTQPGTFIEKKQGHPVEPRFNLSPQKTRFVATENVKGVQPSKPIQHPVIVPTTPSSTTKEIGQGTVHGVNNFENDDEGWTIYIEKKKVQQHGVALSEARTEPLPPTQVQKTQEATSCSATPASTVTSTPKPLNPSLSKKPLVTKTTPKQNIQTPIKVYEKVFDDELLAAQAYSTVPTCSNVPDFSSMENKRLTSSPTSAICQKTPSPGKKHLKTKKPKKNNNTPQKMQEDGFDECYKAPDYSKESGLLTEFINSQQFIRTKLVRYKILETHNLLCSQLEKDLLSSFAKFHTEGLDTKVITAKDTICQGLREYVSSTSDVGKAIFAKYSAMNDNLDPIICFDISFFRKLSTATANQRLEKEYFPLVFGGCYEDPSIRTVPSEMTSITQEALTSLDDSRWSVENLTTYLHNTVPYSYEEVLNTKYFELNEEYTRILRDTPQKLSGIHATLWSFHLLGAISKLPRTKGCHLRIRCIQLLRSCSEPEIMFDSWAMTKGEKTFLEIEESMDNVLKQYVEAVFLKSEGSSWLQWGADA